MQKNNRETELSPNRAYQRIFSTTTPRLAYSPERDITGWRRDLEEALRTAVGAMPSPVPLNPTWMEEEQIGDMTVRRVEFSVEEDVRAVGWLATPSGPGETPSPGHTRPSLPTMICLQGHTSGAHISLGRKHFPGDGDAILGDRDFAVQAVQRGFNAFALEQRAFGLREDGRPLTDRKHYNPETPHTDERCRHMAMVSLLLGRTMIGERVHDVRCALDLLETVPSVDNDRIGITGNSGGGTTSYYAAALDTRIAAVMPGCSVAPYAESIGVIDHCSDNYLPGAYLNFDMSDLAGLIAPRPMVIVSGDQDPLFPIGPVRSAVEQIRSIYTAFGATDHLCHHIGSGDHRFFRSAWDDFVALTGWGDEAARSHAPSSE
jgi:dienelactone hydrolase